MLDLETFGTKPGVVIRSLGAVEFELDGTTGKSVYANVDQASCEAVGLTVDPATVKWWAQQSKAAQNALLVDPKPLKDVVLSFGQWFAARGAVCVWSHGAAFDTTIYEAACTALGISTPWRFFNVRDTRTVFDLFDFDLRDVYRDGTYHNALDDAVYQVKCLTLALRKGRKAAVEPVAGGAFG